MEKTPLTKLNIYPVVYRKDTDGNIVLDTHGNKIIDKSYQEINMNDDYDIIVQYISLTEIK
jgi:hypothetical protein